MDYAGHTAEMTLLEVSPNPVVAPQKAVLAEASEGSGRYVATVRFPLNDLARISHKSYKPDAQARDGGRLTLAGASGLCQHNVAVPQSGGKSGLVGRSLDGVARILSSDGALVRTVYRRAFLKKPEWVHTKEGYSDQVLPPWTPVEAERKTDGRVEVRVWGRRHVFGRAPFPQQIETRGVELLASPITVSGRADGEPVTWQNGRVELTETSETAASLEQVSESDALSLRVGTSIEYDGYMIFDCEFKAGRDLSVENLTLEIPLRTRYATLCQGIYVYPEDPQIPMKRHHGGAVRGDLAFRFSPSIWLGDEERGLCWQAESDEDWHCADEQKAIEIFPRGEITTFRANLVNVPTRLAAGDALRYKLALLATPIKPVLRDSWDLRIVRCEPYGESLSAPDETIRGKPAIQFYRENGIRHLFTTECDMWRASTSCPSSGRFAINSAQKRRRDCSTGTIKSMCKSRPKSAMRCC